MIVHHKTKGIYGFYEGHLSQGIQIDFGRSLKFWPNAQWYYIEQIYTGWYPSAKYAGQGISIVDGDDVKEGQWGQSNIFPNNGEDFVNPPDSFVSHTVYDFKFRVRDNIV